MDVRSHKLTLKEIFQQYYTGPNGIYFGRINSYYQNEKKRYSTHELLDILSSANIDITATFPLTDDLAKTVQAAQQHSTNLYNTFTDYLGDFITMLMTAKCDLRSYLPKLLNIFTFDGFCQFYLCMSEFDVSYSKTTPDSLLPKLLASGQGFFNSMIGIIKVYKNSGLRIGALLSHDIIFYDETLYTQRNAIKLFEEKYQKYDKDLKDLILRAKSQNEFDELVLDETLIPAIKKEVNRLDHEPLGWPHNMTLSKVIASVKQAAAAKKERKKPSVSDFSFVNSGTSIVHTNPLMIQKKKI